MTTISKTIKEARRLLATGKLSTTEEPVHHGRSGNFWPIRFDGQDVSVNNLTAKMDFPSLRSSQYLLNEGVNLGLAQRFGIMLWANRAGHRGAVEAQELGGLLERLGAVREGNKYILTVELEDTNGR